MAKKEDNAKLSKEELEQLVEQEKREREQAFTEELQELMNKHRVEIMPVITLRGMQQIATIDVRAL